MAKITLEVPEELLQQLASLGDRLPELLALSLQQPPLPAHIYRYILNFIASNPTPEEIAAFSPTPEMQQRLRTLVERSLLNKITELERIELDDLNKIEHLIIMLKAGNIKLNKDMHNRYL
ncbi:hypothetical protein H6G81_13640 [Scytonema hofmannii FACHB-248]|uniref:Uncharacterized protein n=1 Tax=Scytonema hofmannii FACHB-248 TaxID=1842502 RepID=A0ABR8GQZ4_9CYAN|nr:MULTISPECIES: hypothetical protein [Nostocales]MBD2605545.1 hypothetical protein [Scytonema hofmannii FACHB-248]